jgi:uncharacterized protein
MQTQRPPLTGSNRIDVVDALRGFAIMCILLLHNMEHFDFMWTPENIPAWRLSIDKALWDVMEFLVAGKAYAIFALLFGFTFWLMDKKQTEKGNDFRLRFLWRMFLLLIFGTVNSLFYEGDILSMYAMLGFTLVLVCRFNDRTVLIIALVMLFQPFLWANVIGQLLHPVTELPPHPSSVYFGKIYPYLADGSFLEAIYGNITNGKIAVYLWSWEKGRFLQAPALFMIGMLLGRRQLFLNSPESKKFWKLMLIGSALAVVAFILIKKNMGNLFPDKALRSLLKQILYSWSNLSMMFFLVSGFVLLFRTKGFKRLTAGLLPFGRMSLTSYVMQSMIGAFIYYGFGFGLFKITDAFWCLLIGIILFLFQTWFCTWWLRSHKQGPLEALWHRWTWFNG